MSNSQERKPSQKGLANTYFVQDRENRKELQRLIIQDRMITTMMGGPLPEQTEPARFHRVLDVGCGSGGWILEAAQAYPHMNLFGIDISRRMIEYAREQAAAQGLTGRVEFLVMDALRMLEFPSGFFGLVNLRLGISWVRKWDWPNLLQEILRVTCSGGVLRIVEVDPVEQSSSAAVKQFYQMLQCAFSRAGHLFESDAAGLTKHLVPLLKQHGYQRVQEKMQILEYRAGTVEGQGYIDDIKYSVQTLRPFFQKWGCATIDYEAFLQQIFDEVQQDDFWAFWPLHIIWGNKPGLSLQLGVRQV